MISMDQIFQDIWSKISLEHIRFSGRKKYNKNRSSFPGELSRNFIRTHTIFQETICKIASPELSLYRSCSKITRAKIIIILGGTRRILD